MLEIFRLHAKETKFKQLEDQRKGSVLKVRQMVDVLLYY